MKFSGICLVTEDVPALVDFYAAVFGCRAQGDAQHAEFNLAGLSLAIFSKAGMEGMAPGSMHGAGYGSFTIGFEVADVDAEYARLQAFPLEIVKPPQTHPWGSRAFWFRDPDGNIIDIFSRVTV